MAAIEQYIERIADKELREQLRVEIERLTKKKRFGLVWENHLPDNVVLPEVRIRRGSKVALHDRTPNEVYEVQSLTEKNAVCINISTMEEKTFPLSELIAVAQRGDVIYPYLKPMDSVQNAPDSDLWHTLIEADNYHALQLLTYLYAGQVDCIYIDPPYNKPDSHDWKYNCDYVDGTDSYRHSKWLSMMEARLKIAKKLLNPKDSVLIVTIDELEYHHLGCLLEQMFPDAKIQMVTDVTSPRAGASRDNEFSRSEEYIFFVQFGTSTVARHLLTGMVNDDRKENNSPIWFSLLRTGNHSSRLERPNLFYPIWVTNEGRLHSIGDSVPINQHYEDLIPPREGLVCLLPIRPNGEENTWNCSVETLKNAFNEGTARIRHNSGRFVVSYLRRAEKKRIERGELELYGKDEDGSWLVRKKTDVKRVTTTKSVWLTPAHDAGLYGTLLVKSIFSNKRFEFPKSLYAVHDTLRFFVANKPNALILDFFAGSGTTLHAVNLLNAEDGGRRRCIMVTNNEIGEPKERELRPLGIRPGDEEWERWGIARYVNWPRTKCSILGNDVNGNPIEGEYITTLTTTKETDRKFTHINFLPADASLKQKKSLVTLINKQKTVKLPSMTQDAPFLVPEEDDYNASILFDLNKKDDWLEALDGNDHITYFYIVAEKDADYKRVKNEVSEMMGKVEETVPVSMPMKDGFKANAVFFKLGFLDKRSVERGRQLQELLPLLWMKAGAKGECPTKVEGDYAIWQENQMALLKDEAHFRSFRKELENHPEVKTVYLITDSQSAYLSMISELKGRKTYQLYRDYLENFRINYAAK